MSLLLHSLPDAPAALVIAFDGSPVATTWNRLAVPPLPAYAGDDVAQQRIFDDVAAAFAPFDIDVTTEMPVESGPHRATRIIVSGGDSSWTGAQLGGISIVGSFVSPAVSQDAYVFAAIYGDNDTGIARAIEHEAGHTLGLEHQSTVIDGVKVAEYASGNADVGPIMGDPDGSAQAVWWVGTNSVGLYQDDAAVIAGPLNGFGYRTPEPSIALIGLAGVIHRRRRR